MDTNYLKRVLGLFDRSTATELVIEQEGMKISISKQNGSDIAPVQPNIMPMPQYYQAPVAQEVTAPLVAQATETSAPVESVVKAKDEDEGLHEIKSPIVGTFYSAPSPDSDSFVEIGTHVTNGQTLCIVEAMKLMNEIESDISGTIVKILIENGEPVEFNNALFLIKPD